MTVKILEPGWQSLIMDAGRRASREWGVPQSGVIDLYRYKYVDFLTAGFSGESGGKPVLEIRSGKVCIEFQGNYRFALTGSPGIYFLDDQKIEGYKVYQVFEGQHLKIDRIRRNGTVYLAIDGIWEVPQILGSQSADILSPFPGILGRFLHAGDCIPIVPSSRSAQNIREISEISVDIRSETVSLIPVLRLLPGPELDLFSGSFRRKMAESDFHITTDSNRMGYRLSTPSFFEEKISEIVSSTVLPGIIQWAPGGPIILLPNGQTTGGYPRVAKVIEADLWKLAYLGPGDVIRFRWTNPEEALYISHYRQKQFERAIRNSFPEKK